MRLTPFLVSLLLILCCASNMYSQDFRYIDYTIEDGLPIELTKCTAQDELGFVWIATDEGLVRFDGEKFKTYPNALYSPYVKFLLLTGNKRLLVAHDLGIDEIISQPDTTFFKPLIAGNREISDTTLWYPKKIFEASNGDWWISEPESVVVYRNGKIKRYKFGDDYKSNSFTRSFHFAEDIHGNLWMISYTGALFRYECMTY